MTLVTVTSVDIDRHIISLIVSSSHIQFAKVKLLSPIKPSNLPSFIEHVEIPNIDFIGYSKFMIEELHKYVESDYCLTVQADGFIVNPLLWTSEFLKYDYIGAPWPIRVVMGNREPFFLTKNRVGNGGFSLRSRELLLETAKLSFDDLNYAIKSEDIVICHHEYERMKDRGIKYAPIEIANSFSLESVIDELSQDLSAVFGFHGKHWLDDPYLNNTVNKVLFSDDVWFSFAQSIPNFLNVNRLALCPCGSKKKYKSCHGKVYSN